MTLRRSRQSLNMVRESYESSNADGVKLMSVQLRTAQKAMLDKIAEYNGISTAAVLRAIVDEWSESILAETNSVVYANGDS